MTPLGLLRISAGIVCLGVAAWLAAFGFPAKKFSPAVPPQVVAKTPAPLEILGSNAIDLGTLRQTETTKKALRVRNNSASTVFVHGVMATCGCTTPKISADRIPAGEVATVNVAFDAHGVRGHSEQYVWVRYSEGVNSPVAELAVRIDAVVTPDYDVTPARLPAFSPTNTTQDLVLTPNAAAAVAIKSLSVNHAWFTATQVKPFAPGRPTVRVQFDPARYDKLMGDSLLTVGTDCPGEEFYLVPLKVTGFVVQPVPTAMPTTPGSKR